MECEMKKPEEKGRRGTILLCLDTDPIELIESKTHLLRDCNAHLCIKFPENFHTNHPYAAQNRKRAYKDIRTTKINDIVFV